LKGEPALERRETRATRKLGRVCTTISAPTAAEMAAKAATAFALGSDLVEFRIDLLAQPGPGATDELERFARKSVMTVRRKQEGGGFRGSEKERLALISEAARFGPLYVDLELRTAKENPDLIGSLPKKSRTIISWHDFAGTPDTPVLQGVREDAAAFGDIVKIVTTAKSEGDNASVLRLYQREPSGLIAFCMGVHGTVSRLVSLQLGSPIAYAALPNEPVAPGQLSVMTMVELKRAWESREWEKRA
jgi:3-dehydroquinate dehydratase I